MDHPWLKWAQGKAVLHTCSTIALATFLLSITLPGAIVAQPPSPVFTLPTAIVRGYQGTGFYVEYAVNNTSHNQVKLANFTITFDYGTFQSGASWTIGNTEVISTIYVPIPSSEPVGNHTFTAAVNLSYQDNNTGNWIPFTNNPPAVTGTLIVLPSPATSALNNIVLPILLPAAELIALPGVVLGARSIRRARHIGSKADASTLAAPRSRFALFTLSSTITIIAAILVMNLLTPFNVSNVALAIGANIIGFTLLLGFIGTMYTRGIYSWRTLRPLQFLSVSATVASSIRLQIIQAANPCSAGIVGAGYPIPWAPIFFPEFSYGPLPMFSCPMVVMHPLVLLALIGFLLDTAFYFAACLCAIELYKILRSLRGKSSLASQTSWRSSNLVG